MSMDDRSRIQYFEMPIFGGVFTRRGSPRTFMFTEPIAIPPNVPFVRQQHTRLLIPRKDNPEHGPIVTFPTDQTMLPHRRSVHPIHTVQLNLSYCRTGRKSPYQRSGHRIYVDGENIGVSRKL
jgi:hypothetical protein